MEYNPKLRTDLKILWSLGSYIIPDKKPGNQMLTRLIHEPTRDSRGNVFKTLQAILATNSNLHSSPSFLLFLYISVFKTSCHQFTVYYRR